MLASNGLTMKSVCEALCKIHFVEVIYDKDLFEEDYYRIVKRICQEYDIHFELVDSLEVTKEMLHDPNTNKWLRGIPCTIVKEVQISIEALQFIEEFVTHRSTPLKFDESYQGVSGYQKTTLFVKNSVNATHSIEHEDDEMLLLESNIDDSTGEVLGYALETLLEHGASDVFYTPITMKKNRPAYKLSVLTTTCKKEVLEGVIFRETSSLGIRSYPVSCHRLGREFIEVNTDWGSVRVKLGFYQGDKVQVSPEFDDCKALAKAHSVSLTHIYDQAKERATQKRTKEVR